MTGWLRDLRYAWRSLAKRPTYALVTVVVFALALGANSTVFSVFNGLFLRPLPYPHGSRLVMVYSSYPKLGVDNAGTSIPDYLDRRAAPSLEGLAMIARSSRTLQREGRPEQVELARATPSLFDVLRIAPALGRAFTASESTPGNDKVILLSYRLWATRFGAQSDVMGKKIRLDGESFRIIGIMPKGFNFFATKIDAWIPFAYTPEQTTDKWRGNSIAISIGRLRPGATLEGLNAELRTIGRRNVERAPQMAAFAEATGYMVRAEPLREVKVGDLEQILLTLQGIVLAILLIACANVTNLQLSRMVARGRELSIRSALGADRWRLTRLVFVESLSLAVAGGACGLALAAGGLALVGGLGLDRSSEGFAFPLDAHVVGFTAAAALCAALLSGLLPLLESRRENLTRVMKESGSRSAGGRGTQRLRNALVVLQIAVSMALLTGAGLLTKNFYRLERQGPGFDSENVWSASVALPKNRYSSADARVQFYRQALIALRALPGVNSAGVTSILPFAGNQTSGTISVDGYTPPSGVPPPVAQLRSVSRGYFDTLRIPVIKGRGFRPHETGSVAIVDELMAKKYWPHGHALGQRVRNDSETREWSTVIGVVPVIKHASLAEEAGKPTVYWPYEQDPPQVGVFTVRSRLPAVRVGAAARAALARSDPDLAFYDVVPMNVRVQRSLGTQRTPMVLTLVFAGLAFALAVVGIYGVLTSAVTQRVGEIAVRLAVGAQTGNVVRMVVGQGARLIAAGLVLGLAGAVGLAQVLASQIQAISVLDPAVMAGAASAVAVAAFLASWLPARRASRVDPMRALREE